MQKFERAHFEVKEYSDSEHYGKFVLWTIWKEGLDILLGMH